MGPGIELIFPLGFYVCSAHDIMLQRTQLHVTAVHSVPQYEPKQQQVAEDTMTVHLNFEERKDI